MDVLRLSSAARRVVEAARGAAAALGQGRLLTVHLLLALLEEPGAAQQTLHEHALPAAALGDQLRAWAREGYTGPSTEKPSEVEQRGSEGGEALEQALEEADIDGRHEVLPVDIFLAATADDRWTAYRALEAAGLDVERMRRDVADGARRDLEG